MPFLGSLSVYLDGISVRTIFVRSCAVSWLFFRPSWRNFLPKAWPSFFLPFVGSLSVYLDGISVRTIFVRSRAVSRLFFRPSWRKSFPNACRSFLRRFSALFPSFLAEVLSERLSFVLVPFLGSLSVFPGGSPFRTLVVRSCAVSRLSFRPSWRKSFPNACRSFFGKNIRDNRLFFGYPFFRLALSLCGSFFMSD